MCTYCKTLLSFACSNASLCILATLIPGKVKNAPINPHQIASQNLSIKNELGPWAYSITPWYSNNRIAFLLKLRYDLIKPNSSNSSSTISTNIDTKKNRQPETMHIERSPIDSSPPRKYFPVIDKSILLRKRIIKIHFANKITYITNPSDNKHQTTLRLYSWLALVLKTK